MALGLQTQGYQCRVLLMKIYLATWTEQNQGVSLTKVGGHHRLISFFFFKEVSAETIKRYATTGVLKEETNEI